MPAVRLPDRPPSRHRRPRRVNRSLTGGTYESHTARHRMPARATAARHVVDRAVDSLSAVAAAARTGIVAMSTSKSPWWLAACCALTVMGLIFNVFGLALLSFSFRADSAGNYFLIGGGLWVLAGCLVGFFSRRPSPGRDDGR